MAFLVEHECCSSLRYGVCGSVHFDAGHEIGAFEAGVTWDIRRPVIAHQYFDFPIRAGVVRGWTNSLIS